MLKQNKLTFSCVKTQLCDTLFETDLQPKMVQSFLGYANIHTTLDLYTHVSEEKKSKDNAET